MNLIRKMLAFLKRLFFPRRAALEVLVHEELELQAKTAFNRAQRNPHRSNVEKRRLAQRFERARLAKKG